jgi:hypothetical protein
LSSSSLSSSSFVIVVLAVVIIVDINLGKKIKGMYNMFIPPGDNLCINEDFLQKTYGYLPPHSWMQYIYLDLISLVPSSLLHCG